MSLGLWIKELVGFYITKWYKNAILSLSRIMRIDDCTVAVASIHMSLRWQSH